MSEGFNSVVDLVGDKVAFEFLDDVSNNKFKTTTKAGIILAESAENQVGAARWGLVISTGPDVNELEVGDYILIEPLRWTTALEIDEYESEFWITDQKSVMAVSNELPE